MTIKTKLTLNIIFVMVIVCAVVATSVIGMGFIKGKLHYLTQRSTPFQMRTIQLQESIQGATAALVEVSAVRDSNGYRSSRGEAEKALAEVKRDQEALEELMGGSKQEIHANLQQSAAELFTITESRLRAEQEAFQSSRAVAQKLKDFEGRLKALDDKVNNAQNQRLGKFSALLEESKDIDTVRDSPAVTQFNLANKVLINTGQIMGYGLSLNGLVKGVFSARTDRELDALQAEIRRVFDRTPPLFKSQTELFNRLKANEEVKLLNAVQGSLLSTRGLINETFGKYRNYLHMQAKAAQVTGRLKEMAGKQSAAGEQTVNTAKGDQEKAIVSVNSMVRSGTMFIITIGIGALVVGCGFGIWVYRSIAKPLSQLIKMSSEVAEGNLTVQIDADNSDEVGKVQAAMATMVINLRGIVGKIAGATQTLASSSEELSATANTIERGSEEQSARVEQSATAMTQMAQTTNEVAQNSTSTSDAAGKMLQIAEHGRNAMMETAQELVSFAETVREAAENVESLGAKSEEITGVVTLIKDIADQTNLLALNAAIEAARAGEQGRGFAVVADEVRALAEKTTTATDEIALTVKTMRSSIAESVNFMQEERESVGKVLDKVNETATAIEEIAQYVDQVTGMIHKIAVAVEQQSSSSDEVSLAMENITGITRELRGSFADIKHSSENLSNLATELNGMVEWFKVA